jgi:hypothetical protein
MNNLCLYKKKQKNLQQYAVCLKKKIFWGGELVGDTVIELVVR